MPRLLLLATLATLVISTNAFAQGSIFGVVANSDLSTPANGQISFVGYLDDTDEEIRIESSVGAGYDAGNWFDDFQNYLTESPGNPYDYVFYNTFNGQGFILSGLIPSNSFQQENIPLAPVTWPAAPTGVVSTTISATSVALNWTSTSGLTYHIYRRPAVSGGSFFRIDNTLGLLSDPGVADSFFVDTTVDGVSSYQYVLISEDAIGNWSPHSAIITANSGIISSPVLASVSPDSAVAAGGTVVDLYGSGFDPAGATVTLGLATVTATVVSPLHLTIVTPVATPGPVDVSVTNVSSALSSNILLGGFVYTPNAAPVLALIGPQQTTEGVLLQLPISATDPEGNTPTLSTSTLPAGAIFTDSLNGSGLLEWTPSFIDAGVFSVTFYATDSITPSLIDSEQVLITVLEAGNQSPVLAAVNDTSVIEGATLLLTIAATDPDAEIPTLAAANLPTNATFIDNGDGTGSFSFAPAFLQAGVYGVTFFASDLLVTDSITVNVTVVDAGNQPPVLAIINDTSINEGSTLVLSISATDPDAQVPALTVANQPLNATFVDSGNGIGILTFIPDFTQAGVHSLTFFASDGVAMDSALVNITVLDAGNQPPVLDSIGDKLAFEGTQILFNVTASDPDGTIPTLNSSALPPGATFVDSGNGLGTFDWTPTFVQAGIYQVLFYTFDGLLADSEIVTITVSEPGNQPPVFAAMADTALDEGATLTLVVNAVDPEGGAVVITIVTSLDIANYTFVDSGTGTAVLTYVPDMFDAGVDTVNFFATDFGTPRLTGQAVVQVTTNEFNQSPVFVPIGPFTVDINDTLLFTVQATDSTDPILSHRIFLSASGLQPNASFSDSGNNSGIYTFAPVAGQEGIDTITFFAVDQGIPQLTASLVVEISVNIINQPPVLSPIGPQIVLEGSPLLLVLTATDPDGVVPSFIPPVLPTGATFVDSGNGVAVFDWTPGFTQAGLFSVTFKATDGLAVDKEVVLIQVNEAGDQAPLFNPLPAPSVVENNILVDSISGFDPDGGPVTIEFLAPSLPAFFTWFDSGNGVAYFTFAPDFSMAGAFIIDVTVSDSTSSTSDNFVITVIEAGNQNPVLDSIPDFTVTELNNLNFTVSATDPDGEIPNIAYDSLNSTVPAGFVFTPLTDGTGIFSWNTTDQSAGIYAATFMALDGAGAADTQGITITVVDTNRVPAVNPFPFLQVDTVMEGNTLQFVVRGTDQDGTVPVLEAAISGDTVLDPNMTFVDSLNGIGVLTFSPDCTQGGNPVLYFVAFRARDAADTSLVSDWNVQTIKVFDVPQAPVLTLPSGAGPFTISEGASLQFDVVGGDCDDLLDSLVARNMPINATFATIFALPGQIMRRFTFNPNFLQAGVYNISFIAWDPDLQFDSVQIQITVTDAGNQPPVFTQVPPDTVMAFVGIEDTVVLRASDPEGDAVTFGIAPPLTNSIMVDSGNGAATFLFTPDLSQTGFNTVTFSVTDGGGSDLTTTTYQVSIFKRGDLDADGMYTINDIAYLSNYLFRQGPEPIPMETGDADQSGTVDVADLAFMVNYIYDGGPKPQ
ncbi:MAG: Ig-like domain-containing protein [Candidatus Zixiibacteriota bacterium]